jgi:adenosylmethionine-8-amino-7-oxononanoate aminotransferase
LIVFRFEEHALLTREELKENARYTFVDLRQMKSFCASPIIIAEAKGIYLTDIDGKRYIDGISGIYVANVGHGHEYVIEAICRQYQKLAFVAPLHALADTLIEYTTRLAQVTPQGLNTVFPLSGGSEATETAMKFARQYHRQSGNTAKYKFLSLYKGFHGATMGAMSAGGVGGKRKSVFGPFLEGYCRVAPPLCFHCPYGLKHPACDCLCARQVEYVIQSEGPESVAGFILEPIGNTGGIVTPPPEYLPLVRQICTKHNVLLIFDEVITGMGRTGNWFAAQTFQTTPDLLCLGKAMGGGYAPLAGVAIRDDLYFNTFWGEDAQEIQFAHGHTYGGNPIAAAAGLAVIEVIERENLLANGCRVGNHIRARLETEVSALGILGEVRGKGCLIGVEFVENMRNQVPFPSERQFGKRVEKRMLEKGLILRCNPDWIAFGPPLNTTIPQADEIVDVFMACLKEELESGP